jgi:hypothetical protein
LATVSKPSLEWVGSEVPSDMHALLDTFASGKPGRKEPTGPKGPVGKKEKTDFVHRDCLGRQSIFTPSNGLKSVAGGR